MSDKASTSSGDLGVLLSRFESLSKFCGSGEVNELRGLEPLASSPGVPRAPCAGDSEVDPGTADALLDDSFS